MKMVLFQISISFIHAWCEWFAMNWRILVRVDPFADQNEHLARSEYGKVCLVSRLFG